MINNIPLGEQIVTVSKKGYETKIFMLNIKKGVLSKIEKIELKMTKKLRKEREKIRKQQEKERKEKLKKVEKETKKAEKEREKLEKELAKQQKKELKRLEKEKRKREKEIKALAKNNNSDVKIEYQAVEKPEDNQTVASIEDTDVNVVEPLSEIQIKYAKILGVEPTEVENKKLYEFIDKWTGTAYLIGGETKDGIDCSSFTQRLYTKVFDKYIERTAEKQFKSRFNDEFKDKTYLAEGDLIFFNSFKDPSVISHVGVYLQNNKFVHSTSSIAKTGLNGVQISDLTDPKWEKRFVAGGKRLSGDN